MTPELKRRLAMAAKECSATTAGVQTASANLHDAWMRVHDLHLHAVLYPDDVSVTARFREAWPRFNTAYHDFQDALVSQQRAMNEFTTVVTDIARDAQ